VRNGFSIDEIYDMTLDQVKLYNKSCIRLYNRELAAFTASVMMGSRGEEKATKKYIKGLEQS